MAVGRAMRRKDETKGGWEGCFSKQMYGERGCIFQSPRMRTYQLICT